MECLPYAFMEIVYCGRWQDTVVSCRYCIGDKDNCELRIMTGEMGVFQICDLKTPDISVFVIVQST